MEVRILQDFVRFPGLPFENVRAGDFLDVEQDVGLRLIENGLAEEVHSEFLGEGLKRRIESQKLAKGAGGDEAKIQPFVDSKLAAWLEEHGFNRALEGTAYSKIDKLETGAIIKLIVDFKDGPKGNRYGLRLNEETGGWKTDEVLRDFPLLLEFKKYRDDILAANAIPKEEKLGSPRHANMGREISSGEGQALILEVEKRDEAQILAEISGDFGSEVLKEYFYSFDMRGRKVIGLSYKGIKQIILRHGKVELKDMEIRETDRGFTVIVKAWDKVRDITVYGVKWESKDLPMALERAVSKAQRNALKFLIPEAIITEAYRAWTEERGR